ncbi:hypothetical protein EMPS_01067 [Entomortierella parvispora]|uniref:Peptidase S9 prolyl oligopeptidase catalytic domain-containing protein n=1 Tax=Entomortierella parvispora TaxID=205924 RepID=A0A9P3H240_9FUNG|nr:hypothetical protein EMPS_01067 [Entomortierella parvispora]
MLHSMLLIDHERFQTPERAGDYYYYFHNSGLQAQDVLYQQDTLTSEPRVFLNPNTLEADGTAALNTIQFSKSGKFFAYGISLAGPDWVTIYLQDSQGNKLEDVIQWAKFTNLSFTHDDKGFFYGSGKFLNEIPIPIGTIGTAAGRRSDDEIFFLFTSFLDASTIYCYSFTVKDEEQRLSVFKRVTVTNFDPDLFVVKQVFYESKDGTQIPMFVAHKKVLVIDGNRPVFLYGYGGFSIPVQSSYFPSDIVYMQNFKIFTAPELFGAAVASVGVMDMLRFHKFTIGHAWQSDFGKPDENKEDFENLRRYSPLHNVSTSHPYPPVALFTSSHDDRVVPLHSYKYIAELQHTAGPLTNSPLLIRVDTKAGHGAGKLIDKRIAEITDQFSFISIALDIEWRE